LKNSPYIILVIVHAVKVGFLCVASAARQAAMYGQRGKSDDFALGTGRGCPLKDLCDEGICMTFFAPITGIYGDDFHSLPRSPRFGWTFHFLFYEFFCNREDREHNADESKTQCPDEYSIGEEGNEDFVPATFEAVDQERPRGERQGKEIVSDKNTKVPNHDNVKDADYKGILDTFFQLDTYAA
jgi:hypothetical protein